MQIVKPRLHLVRSIVWLLAVFCAHSPLAYADYQAAAKAYLEKDYEKAMGEFRQLAELGHPDSQYALGVMYYQGHGARKNLMLAYGWLRLAADAGNAKAKEIEPQVRAQMEEESVDRARGLVGKYAPEAISNRLMPKIIANCEYQDGTPPDPRGVSSPPYPPGALAAGVQGFVLLSLYIAADGTVRDARVVEAMPRGAFESVSMQTALTWKMKPASRNGHSFATWAQMPFIFMINGNKSPKVAARLEKIKLDAEGGDPAAQYIYAMLLAAYPDYQKPWSEVLPWLLKSAQGGVADAQYMVSRSLSFGQGCEADSAKALEWLLRAAQQDLAHAQVDLAKLTLKTGPNYDPKKGLFWLERAAAKDAHGRKYLAALVAASPEESLRDPKRALELLDASADDLKGDILVKEIRAAALAASGQYTDAVKFESEAIAGAKKRRWDLTELNERLAAYQSGKPWYGDLLTY